MMEYARARGPRSSRALEFPIISLCAMRTALRTADHAPENAPIIPERMLASTPGWLVVPFLDLLNPFRE